MPNSEQRTDSIWVLVWKAEDVEGWLAHALAYDVVTQGGSIGHAVRMAREACQMILEDDLEAGLEPLDRKAPAEYWQRLTDLFANAKVVQVGALSDEEKARLTFAFLVTASASIEATPAVQSTVEVEQPAAEAEQPKEAWAYPVAA